MRRSFRSSSNGTSKSNPHFPNEPLVHKTLWNYGRLKKLDAGCKKAAVICVKLRKDILDPRCGKQVRRFPRLWNLPLMQADGSRLPFWFGELMQDKRITSIFGFFFFFKHRHLRRKKLILLLGTSCPLITEYSLSPLVNGSAYAVPDSPNVAKPKQPKKSDEAQMTCDRRDFLPISRFSFWCQQNWWKNYLRGINNHS